MKRISIIIALLVMFAGASIAQIRGPYGTMQTYTQMTGTIYNNSMTVRSADTLKGVDTAYVYFSFATPLKLQMSLQTVPVSDTFSGTAVLQAWAGPNTGWVTRTGRWESVTGQTTLCTTCVGSSKTYSAASTSGVATWDIGSSGPQTFSNYRVRLTGIRSTDTCAVTGWAWYSY